MRYMARVLKAALEKKFPEAAEKDVLKVTQINFSETRICASYTQSIVLKIYLLLSYCQTNNFLTLHNLQGKETQVDSVHFTIVLQKFKIDMHVLEFQHYWCILRILHRHPLFSQYLLKQILPSRISVKLRNGYTLVFLSVKVSSAKKNRKNVTVISFDWLPFILIPSSV